MKSFNQFIFLLFTMCLMLACASPKSLTKKGFKKMDEGQYSQASKYFKQALQKNQNYEDARGGLVGSSDKEIKTMIQNGLAYFSQNDYRQVVYQYRDCDSYLGELNAYGVKHILPTDFVNAYGESKDLFLAELYNQGKKYMAEERFESAESVFNEINSIDPNYKDAGKLESLAYLRPIYKRGTDAYNQKDYRRAYYEFEKVVQADANFENALALKAECLEKGKWRLAILPFRNAATPEPLQMRVHAYTFDALTQLQDPFLQIVESVNADQIILNHGGTINSGNAQAIGNAMGADAVLSGTLISYIPVQSPKIKSPQPGYESYEVTVTNAEGKEEKETRYKAVTYLLWNQQTNVVASFQYKIISLYNGEIVSTRILEKGVENLLQYATYAGQGNRLFPSDGEKPLTSSADVNQLRALLTAPQNSIPVSEIGNEVFRVFAGDLQAEVQRFLE